MFHQINSNYSKLFGPNSKTAWKIKQSSLSRSRMDLLGLFQETRILNSIKFVETLCVVPASHHSCNFQRLWIPSREDTRHSFCCWHCEKLCSGDCTIGLAVGEFPRFGAGLALRVTRWKRSRADYSSVEAWLYSINVDAQLPTMSTCLPTICCSRRWYPFPQGKTVKPYVSRGVKNTDTR